MLQDGVVAEVVLVGGLDREGPLCSHPPHCLTHIECPHVLQLGQTNVQGTEGTWGEEREGRRHHYQQICCGENAGITLVHYGLHTL